ncbi:MAG: hypothetical protein ACI4MN_04000 [Candidatus Coproplasma sp.]
MKIGETAVFSDTAVKIIGDREFYVKRHFTGEKNLDEVLTRIAVSKVYATMRADKIKKNTPKNSKHNLAKSGAI